jgi:hypothetical protein
MLSQALMDRVARMAFRMQGTRVETVTYHARTTPGGTPGDHTVAALVRTYRLAALSTGEIQPGDREGLLATAHVTWAMPTTHDTLTRADGSLWHVLSVTGGTGRPFWILQCRQVG